MMFATWRKLGYCKIKVQSEDMGEKALLESVNANVKEVYVMGR